MLLAVAAGCVDAVSFIVLHHIFTANMTGNTTILGIAAGRGDGAAVLPLAVAVVVFVAAIVLATALLEIAARRGLRSSAAPMLALEAALVAAMMVDGRYVIRHNTTPDHFVGFYTLLTLAIVAMGIQTASLTQALGRTLRTTYVSGLLTTFGQDLLNALWPPPAGRASYLRDELGLGSRGESLRRLLLRLAVWTAFLGGAVWGGFGERRWTTWTLAASLGAIAAAAAIDLRRPLYRERQSMARR